MADVQASARLPIFGRAACVALRDGIQSFNIFVERRTTSCSSKKDKKFGTPYVIAVNRWFPEARMNRMDRETLKARPYEGLMARNFMERGARCQVRCEVERIRLFLHTKS